MPCMVAVPVAFPDLPGAGYAVSEVHIVARWSMPTHLDFTQRSISGQVLEPQYLREFCVNQLCTVVRSRANWATGVPVTD